MFAIDTNTLVRYLIEDDPQQSSRARAFIDARQVFVSVTVILELAWVLRSGYRLKAEEVGSLIESLAGLPTVVLEEPDVIATAIDLARSGFEFADALHFARSDWCDSFVTFDRKLAAVAQKVGRSVELL